MTEQLTICICTFRRETVFDTLRSIAKIDVPADVSLSIVVIDNDDTDRLGERIAAYAATGTIPVRYVHAPGRNISIARNAALDVTETKWAAFIDDDEVADRAWLANLWTDRESARAILGRSQAVYHDESPSWLPRCDFHSNRIEGSPVNGYTSNVLFDAGYLRAEGIRFRESLGRTGGEDTIFFRELDRSGGTIRYCENSVVFEPVPPSRATMRWVCRRMFRAGQTHGLMCSEFKPSEYKWLALTAGAKAAASGLMSLVNLPGTVRSRRWLARACLHCGAVSYRLRPGILEEYSSG